MKRRLNILCALVVLVLSYSVYETVALTINAAIDGFQEGLEIAAAGKSKSEACSPAIEQMKPIALLPTDFTSFHDSVYNEKSNTYVPALYTQLMVLVPTKSGLWTSLVIQLFSFLFFIAILMAIILFIQLIVSINKSDIFKWKNVYRLRWAGGALIISYLSLAIPSFLVGYELSEVFALRGYSLYQSDLTSITTLILGFASLIVAEVFAIGLKMKEEQDLTI